MNGPITVVGGKSRLAKRIIELFPEHVCYAEPFAGGAQVFFHKPHSKVEVLNDLDGEVVNFFRVCQAHHEELIRCLRYHLASRKWFDMLKATDPVNLTDIQRAVRFFYIRRLAFGGRVRTPTFGYGTTGRPRFRSSRIPDILKAAHERLLDVHIECLPYSEILRRYDRPDTLFYCDPPYWKLPYYNHNLRESDFGELAEALGGLKGRFILSLNDVPEIRRLFRSFHILDAELTYSCNRVDKGATGLELLIHNIPPNSIGKWSAGLPQVAPRGILRGKSSNGGQNHCSVGGID